MDPSIQNIMAHTNWNTTNIWHSTIKLILKLTLKLALLDSKPQKKNHTYTYSNVSIAKVIIKWIATSVLSKSIDLIMTGIARNLKSSKKSEPIQFT